MPHGHNLATCSECGQPYITGDCIDLGGKCDKCKGLIPITEIDLTHLPPPDGKAKMKQEITNIMNEALSSHNSRYLREEFNSGGVHVIDWRLVEKHIKEAVDLYWPKGKKDE